MSKEDKTMPSLSFRCSGCAVGKTNRSDRLLKGTRARENSEEEGRLWGGGQLLIKAGSSPG